MLYQQIKRIVDSYIDEYSFFMGIEYRPSYELQLKEVSHARADIDGIESLANTRFLIELKKHILCVATNLPIEKYILFHELKISEIIYCHTSSNIAPKDDAAFRSMCKIVGIQFSIYGIDQLAQDLYLKHRGIVKEYLHIAIDTNQIESKEDFIKHYDASKLAAPLATQFLFREDALDSIDNLFEKTDVVILTGPAGTGKTRLALQYAETYSQSTGSQLLCIHDNALPIYEDLALYMETPGHYVLVVDDANQLSGLQHVVQYAIKQADGYQVKILITVRDYAVSKVKDQISGITSFEILPISLLLDDQIRQLIKQELGIQNERYLARIARLAEGNARIAMLAGKLASEANRLDSIDDITQLYSVYYSSALVESGLESDTQLLATAGLIAFLRTLHIDYIDPLEAVLEQCQLTKETFIEKLYVLHKLEIVDMCNDKAVRFSEQCLANYILKYVYCDRKIISLRTMIRSCFNVHQERTLSAINTLLGVYHVDELHTFVGKEIKAVWEDLANENDPAFFKYVKAFHPVNPTETLIMMQEIVESEEAVCIPIEELNTDVDKSFRAIKSDILIILGGFADANVLIKASRIILSKVRYSRFIPHLYFSLLFNEYRNTPESVVKKYESDLELLEDIYIESISYSQHDDHDGKFLKEIYQTSPTILDKFISKILCSTNRPHFDEYREKSLAFFALNNADQVFDTIVDSLIASAQYALYDVSDFIESIVTPKQNNDELAQKQDQWIRHFIIGNFGDKDKMEYLFYGIAELPTERKVSYIKLLLEHNASYEIFESLPLFPMITSWTNSAVPHLTSRIKYMEQILPNLSGLKFIKHKKRIENIIDGLREEIRQEEIRDILDS